MSTQPETTPPYIPIWCRPPNKFVKYSDSLFNDGRNIANITTAHFKDKKGNDKSMVARVQWETT